MVRRVVKSCGFGWLAIAALLITGLSLHEDAFLPYLGVAVGGAVAGWVIKKERPSERVYFTSWMAAAALAGSSSLVLGLCLSWSIFGTCLVLEKVLRSLGQQDGHGESV